MNDLDFDNVEKVYLDCDGVLSSFQEDCYRHHYPDRCLYKDWEPNQYRLDIQLRMPIDKVFEPFTVDWWASMGTTSWLSELLMMLAPAIADSKVVICSAPFKDDHRSVEGKAKWIEKHVPHIPYQIRTDKHSLACSKSILIDDFDFNCDDFKKQGGHSILFPRLWNSNFEIEDPVWYTYTRLKECLTEIERDSNLERGPRL